MPLRCRNLVLYTYLMDLELFSYKQRPDLLMSIQIWLKPLYGTQNRLKDSNLISFSNVFALTTFVIRNFGGRPAFPYGTGDLRNCVRVRVRFPPPLRWEAWNFSKSYGQYIWSYFLHIFHNIPSFPSYFFIFP